MAWINSDDLYSNHCFEIVAEVFTKYKNIDWITGLSITYDEKDRIIGAHSSRDFTRLDFLNGDFKWVQQESTFWRRDLWNKAGNKLGDYKLASDFELWMRFSRYSTLYCVDAYLGGFRLRSSNQLSLEGMTKYLDECNEIIKNEPKDKKELKDLKLIKKLKILEKILCKVKILNKNLPQKIITKLKNKKYGKKHLVFDRFSQEFIILP